MNRYLCRVQYVYPDDTVSYEPVCVLAETETAAREQVDEATARYAAYIGPNSRIVTVLSVTEEAA